VEAQVDMLSEKFEILLELVDRILFRLKFNLYKFLVHF
jgi:hypothetical protein